MTNPNSDACVLSFDLSPKRLRGIVVDEHLDVLYADEVTFDLELPAYGTINGVHSRMGSSTWPCHMHVRALDMLLEKLANGFSLSRIKLITGSAPQHSSVWWSKSAPSLLSRLAPHRTLADQLPSHQTFTLPDPPTPADVTASPHAQHFQWYATSSAPSPGAGAFAERTGARAVGRMLACQVVKVLQTKRAAYEATERISVASGLIGSLLLGAITPMTEGEAATTGLWNVVEREWDQQMLGAVVTPGNVPSPVDTAPLLRKLGTPEADPCRVLDPLAPYFVRRYGFDPSCSIVPFCTTHQATCLSYSLSPHDVLVSLGKDDADVVIAPSPSWLPDQAWQTIRHPAERRIVDGGEEGGRRGEEAGFVVMEYRDAALARSSIRDMYCSGSWHVFDTLVSLIAEGGKIGLDDKLFAFFWPHGEVGVWQGISRFDSGQRVDEFQDRRVNPRMILESQFLTMRVQLSRLQRRIRRLQDPNVRPIPTELFGFDPYDRSALPRRLVVFGGATDNRVLIDLLASIMGCRIYQPTALASGTYAPRFRGRERAISLSGIGAAYKAVYSRYLAASPPSPTGSSQLSYDAFLRHAFQRRNQRNRATMLEGRRPSVPIITTSIASFEAPEATPDATTPGMGRRMSFSTVKLATPPIGGPSGTVGGLPGEPSGSGTPTAGTGVLVVPIHTHPDDAEAGLIQVADPDPDLCERYGGIVEEFARLDSFVSRGLV